MEGWRAALGDSPRWFQLYWSTSDELVESLVARAEACGCDAIVVTLDTTLLGWRTRDLDLGYLPFLRGKGIAQYTSDPVFRRLVRGGGRRRPRTPACRPRGRDRRRAPSRRCSALMRRADLRASRSSVPRDLLAAVAHLGRPAVPARATRLPILLKGILHPDDARRALDDGVDGVIVSNHGGRQVDGAIATLDALPGVVEAVGGARAGAARQRGAQRRRRVQGARARRARRAAGAPLRLRARARGRGRACARCCANLHGRLRPDPGPRRLLRGGGRGPEALAG